MHCASKDSTFLIANELQKRWRRYLSGSHEYEHGQQDKWSFAQNCLDYLQLIIDYNGYGENLILMDTRKVCVWWNIMKNKQHSHASYGLTDTAIPLTSRLRHCHRSHVLTLCLAWAKPWSTSVSVSLKNTRATFPPRLSLVSPAAAAAVSAPHCTGHPGWRYDGPR